MAEPHPDYRKRYEELMRGASERMRAARRRDLEQLQNSRARQTRRAAQETSRRDGELRRSVAMLLREIARLDRKLEACADAEERVLLRAEKVHFEAVVRSLRADLAARGRAPNPPAPEDPVSNARIRRMLAALDGPHRDILLAILEAGNRKPRKPPEAGMPVPAVPPRGPLPKTGGAEAPLDFER